MVIIGIVPYLVVFTLTIVLLIGIAYYAFAYHVSRKKKTLLLSGVATILFISPLIAYLVNHLYILYLVNAFKYETANRNSIFAFFICLAVGLFLVCAGLFSKKRKVS
ncbi:hypothetical protein [Bacillus sp. 1P06AnD]|uniref:hypothetical protein n=1 Tax=Bacillus sp. 1P06AnD TaxID=3132208 RepID=UPI00399F0D6A